VFVCRYKIGTQWRKARLLPSQQLCVSETPWPDSRCTAVLHTWKQILISVYLGYLSKWAEMSFEYDHRIKTQATFLLIWNQIESLNIHR
jgi:hypothetical protein